MTGKKKYYFFILFFLLQIILLQSGCKKEYSYEGGPALVITHDSVVVPPVIVNTLPGCSLCRPADELILGKWNFKTGNSFICGSVDASGFIAEKTAFTFFGPSACSIDTGLVITIYLPVILDQDRNNIFINKAAFYYYDHHAATDILISLQTAQFSATIDSYIYATGIATGRFSGTVFKPNGDTAFVRNGNYKVKVK